MYTASKNEQLLNILFFLVLTIQFSLLFDIKVALKPSHWVRTICGSVVATDIAKKRVIIQREAVNWDKAIRRVWIE